MQKILDTHIELHHLGYLGREKIMCRFPRNDYEPDLYFFNRVQTQNIGDSTTIFPIPRFIAEVLSVSTEQRDRGVKFEDFERNGVGEYWIVNATDNLPEQYILNGGCYEQAIILAPGDTLDSPTFPNLNVDLAVFFDGVVNLRGLQNLLNG